MTINVIVGPPCAGKSTHVKVNSTIGNVLVDYDELAMALGPKIRIVRKVLSGQLL